MSDAWIAALSAVLTAMFSFAGVYLSNRRNHALIAYRLEQLEKKVDRHNQVVERTFRLEGRMTEAEHDISDMKRRGK